MCGLPDLEHMTISTLAVTGHQILAYNVSVFECDKALNIFYSCHQIFRHFCPIFPDSMIHKIFKITLDNHTIEHITRLYLSYQHLTIALSIPEIQVSDYIM